jgi:hypothetical protein
MIAMIRNFFADIFAGLAEALRTGGKGEER